MSSDSSAYSSSSSSDSSSDSSSAGLARDRRTAAKLERLRRIFLSQPSSATTKRGRQCERAVQQPSVSPSQRHGLQHRAPARRQSSKSSSLHHRQQQRRRSSIAFRSRTDPLSEASSAAVSSSTDGEATDRATHSRVRTSLSIDTHVHALCEQVERLTAARATTTSHVHAALDQALDELQFVKKQEERTLALHVQQIEEAFALRLDVFEQQYVAKVAAIERERRDAILQQHDRAAAAIAAAAKQLQDRTQQAATAPVVTDAFANDRSDRSADERSSRFAQRLDRPRPRSLSHSRGANDDNNELSPVAKQKAKLRALEAKLATFSHDSVARITRALTPSSAKQSSGRRQSAPVSPRLDAPTGRDWASTPLSPLRTNPSYWRRGISLEQQTRHSEADAAASNSDMSPDRHHRAGASTASHSQPPQSRQRLKTTNLTSRFLRPEEELELRRLRNSIGLAKDWMEQHE